MHSGTRVDQPDVLACMILYSLDQAVAPPAQLGRAASQMSFEPTAPDELGHRRLLYGRATQIVELFGLYQIAQQRLGTDDVAKSQGGEHDLGKTSDVDHSVP